MKASIDELRDPLGLVVAIATGVGVWLLTENILLALPACASVLLLKSGVAALLHARHRAAPVGPHYGLTPREREILPLVAGGLRNKEIAAALSKPGRTVKERTVETFLQHIRDKLDLHSRTEIAVWAVEHGFSEKSGSSTT